MSKNPRQVYEQEILGMPAGLERAALRLLTYHVGKENAIGKPGFLAQLARSGFHVSERQLRAAIVNLRKDGKLICSSSGEGGYFIAANIEEYQEFRAVEYHAKIVDMSTTMHAMDTGAQALFRASVDGQPAKQAGLF